MALKYLFTAIFPDGSTLSQTPDDESAIDPKRSAFYDVLQRLQEPIRFTLAGDGHTYSVDLKSGEFTLDDPFTWMERDDLPTPDASFRLVYYRQHRHHFKAGSNEEVGHEVTYCMGWQATIEGKNYQQIIGIS
jgi:hypothetical protein